MATPLCSLRFGVSASVPSPLPRRCSRTTGIQIKAAKDSALWASPLGQATGCGFLGKHDRLDPGGPSLQGASGRSLGSSWQPVCAAAVWRKEGRTASADRPTDRDGVALRHVVVRPAGMPRHPYRNRTTHLLEDKCSQGKRVLCSPLLSRPATERVNRATPEWVKPARASDA